MADLLTHYAAARLPGAFFRDRRLPAFLILGTFLPDLVSKGLYWICFSPEDYDNPSHSLVGLLPLCFLASLFVEEKVRKAAFGAMYAGAVLHVAVDLIKDNQGTGAAFLFHPFSTAGTEFGWLDPENVIYLLPLDLALLGIAWLVERRRLRVQQ